ncbi:MAG TPA: hemolysin III family protein [Burkholderiaceae bacterium]|nr:hemolysin III family protein [Burkholderiaceae bacterium]
MGSARHQSRPEEWANAASHAAGVVLAAMALPWLMQAAERQGGRLGVLAMAVFVATMALQFGVSALYHALPAGRAKLWARAADHAAIYLFIAGSATPFALGLLGGDAGIATCLLLWILAIAGATLKLRRRLTSARLSTGLYILFGWLAVLLLVPDLQQVDRAALAWLVGGGLSYMVGAGFFVFDASLRFGHFIWHLFVLAGSSCHVCAAIWPSL